MSRRSGSTLFLMEQLIVVATFAICAAACLKIMTASYFMAIDTRDMGNAIRAAETGAECFKATSGDIEKTAGLLSGAAVNIGGEAAVLVYYDEEWQISSDKSAVYILRIISVSPTGGPVTLRSAELTVEKTTGDRIIGFPVAARSPVY